MMKTIEIDTGLKASYLGNLKASPSFKRYAFVQAQTNIEKNHYEHTLYVGVGKQIKKVKKLNKNQQFIFLTDDVLLLDLQKNKTEQTALKDKQIQSYYRYDLNKKSLEKAFELPFRGSIEAVIDETTLLVSAVMTPADHVLYQGDQKARDAYLKEHKKQQAYEAIDHIPYLSNGRDFTTDQQKQLFIYHINSGNLKPILKPHTSAGIVLLSNDKRSIYFTAQDKQMVASLTPDVYQYDLKTDTSRILYQKRDYKIANLIEFDNKLVALASDMKAYGLNQNCDFYTLEDHTLKPLAIFSQSGGNTIGSDMRLLKSNQHLIYDNTYYFITTIDDHSELYALQEDGNLNPVFRMSGSLDGIVMNQDRMMTIGMTNQDLQEVHIFDESLSVIETCTTFNTWLDQYHVIEPEVVECHFENHTVKGFVLLPKDYNPSKSSPAILNIHGGPKTVYGQVFYHEMQYWANQGYVVMFANPRGSDGKGDQFADIRGKYGTIDYDDLMAFVDQVIHTYQGIDENHLYLTGGSYGGFMTNWMVAHTDRFKAAVTQRSISNWLSFYGTSDIGYFFAQDQTGGHPLNDMDQLYEQSPIKYAMNIKTPLLLVHADKDHRCPIEQAQQLYAILKLNGVDSELFWVKNENHELSRGGKPQARLARLEAITSWFEKYK